MMKLINRLFAMKLTTKNRIMYTLTLLVIFSFAWVSGERLLYVSLALFVILPIISLLVTFLLFMGLTVKQTFPEIVVKNSPAELLIEITNDTPMPFGNVECFLYSDELAIESEQHANVLVKAFKYATLTIPFKTHYRGYFQFGLKSVTCTDMMGLFRIKKKMHQKTFITSMPRILDLQSFPIVANLMSQAQSRYDMKDEDYSTISDVRQYQQADSIKRVHWKLTAKRNEWLVKVFQSNALNSVTMIMDNHRYEDRKKDMYQVEDHMVEMTLALSRLCIKRGMPVDFYATNGARVSAKSMNEFELIYKSCGTLQFELAPPLNPLAILTHTLNEATGYVNAILLTARLDAALLDKVLNAVHNGHYIAVCYFTKNMKDYDSEDIYKQLADCNVPVFKITDKQIPDVFESEAMAA